MTQLIIDWYSIDTPLTPWLTLHQHLDQLIDQLIFTWCIRVSQHLTKSWSTDCWSSVMIGTPLTPWLTLHQQLSTNFRSMHMINAHSADYWSVNQVDWVAIVMLIKCWSRCQLRVSIDTWLQMPFVHRMQFFYFISRFFLVLDLIEKYWTLETVFDHISNYLEVCQNYSASYFQLSSQCSEMWSNMVFHVWCIGKSLLTSLFTFSLINMHKEGITLARNLLQNLKTLWI